MHTLDFTGYDTAEALQGLKRDLVRQIDEAICALQQAKREEVLASIETLAKEAGLTPEAFMQGVRVPKKRRRKAPGAAPTSASPVPLSAHNGHVAAPGNV